MWEQLRLLADLQLLDSRLQALRYQHEQLPQKLSVYEQACEEANKRLTSIQSIIADADKERRSLERELDNDQERLLRTQSRLHAIKTNKEYSAILAEIESGKDRIARLEDRVLELMEVGDAQQQSTQTHELVIQQASQELEQQAKKIHDTQRELVEEISINDAEREQLLIQVSDIFLAAYERASSLNRGVGVVTVNEGICAGCYLRIPPQMVSEIRQQDAIVTCPHCQRILLWPA